MSAEDELCRQLTVYFFANIVSKLGNNISIKEDVMKRRRVYVTLNVQVNPDGIVRPRSMIRFGNDNQIVRFGGFALLG